MSSERGFGTTRSMQITELQYLNKGDVITSALGTSVSGLLNGRVANGGLSVFYMKPVIDNIGEW